MTSEIQGVDAPPPRRRGTYRVSDGAKVAQEEAVAAWAEAARPVLEGIARRYGTWITYKDLSEKVQAESGIRTTQLMRYWIGKVLGCVARAQPPDEPILTSFVVDSNGEIGKGYVEIVKEHTGEEPLDIEEFAARERLACHKHFGAELPADGGKPVYTEQVRSKRERKRKKLPKKPPSRCPTCHTELPRSGVCGDCS